MSDARVKIGITHGDFNGIGYEVMMKALVDPRMTEFCTFVVYGSSKAAAYYRKNLKNIENFNFNIVSKASEANAKQVNLIDCVQGEVVVEPGEMKPAAGAASVAALQRAAQDLKDGFIDAIVTAPICKENIQNGADFVFTGHTEFFAAEFGGEPLMVMCSEQLKVGLVTIHIPIAEVSAAISQEKVEAAIKSLRACLVKDFAIREPRIAVLGLNPHAGDGGVIGTEEQEIMAPAIRAVAQEGVLAFGPFPADGFFAASGYTKYDAVLAMYHDQGLAPFKALSGAGVNFTAGLSVVRTSPAHGVGFDIAGQGVADERSMREAIFTALDVLRSRKMHAEITANPLQKFKRDYGADVSVFDLPEAEN